jgi:hypothetical protein
MRNKFAGDCYRCGLNVQAGTGHFERHGGRWRTQHALHVGRGAVTCDMAAAEAIRKEVELNAAETARHGSVS